MKKSISFLVITITVTLVLMPADLAVQRSQSADVLLGAALHQEEVEGDYEAAIETYKKLLVLYPGNRPLAAQAQLRIGMCYEKLGSNKFKLAQDAFQKVVDNYPMQSEEFKIAREKLSRMSKAQSILEKDEKNNKEGEVIPNSMTLQKVWSSAPLGGLGGVSPDGRFLSYSAVGTDLLAIRELSTGKTSILTNYSEENPEQFNMGSTVSPNNKQIAYAWYKNNYEIRLVDIDNPQPKVLYGNKGEDVYPCAWSPDGKTIYAKSYLNNTGQCRILAISVSSGSIQILKTFNMFYWLQLCVSHDNQFIAYDYPNVNNGEISDKDIHLISTDGKNETTQIRHPANDQILGWFPNKNQILFKSDRSGTWDAWTVSVVNGKVAGEPNRVLTEIGQNAIPMGFTKNGTFYYSLNSRKGNAFTMPLDQIRGEIKSELSEPLLGSIRAAKWSPDGKSIALIKELWNLNRRPLSVLDLETGKERMLSDRFNVSHLLWLQDNKRLLILGYDKKRESEKNYTGEMFTINVQSGEVNELLAFSDYRGKNWEIGLLVAQLLAEGKNNQKSIYYLKNGQLICRELATGQEKTLLKDQSLYSNNYTLDPLPGEKNLLYCNEDQIYIIPVFGGKQIPIMKRNTTNSGPSVRNSAVWSTDGNYIFYTQNIDGGSVLWRISAEGENPKEVWRSKVPISSLSIHPNGQKIVISTLDQGAEIWKVDNLLSNEETGTEGITFANTMLMPMPMFFQDYYVSVIVLSGLIF